MFIINLFFQENNLEESGIPSEQFLKQSEGEHFPFLENKDSGVNTDIRNINSVKTRNNGKKKKGKSKNRHSAASLPMGHIPATHPTS